jgi:hypothetical protein
MNFTESPKGRRAGHIAITIALLAVPERTNGLRFTGVPYESRNQASSFASFVSAK